VRFVFERYFHAFAEAVRTVSAGVGDNKRSVVVTPVVTELPI
jgi:hypothetical protein